ncbi:XRE family transcriptional regulator [Massilia sp. IC2-477]|uniref:helix-turn-helix domain-containing protein n=1 Tax=Massilia sp. IC2-477 TaxID=2887198 RepID=UPI001D103F42|nr:XRE family transcriptional regulator [Massilia sp. IC2-477]MCC2956037.1 XRE family transcriptional regulator [Massilia sp. IC2-477]
MDINELIARRVKALREEADLSLAALAELSGVSRSNISLIERGESSPTATVLDKLASALGVTLASLFEQGNGTEASPLSRAADQPVWTDPVTGYTRRNLSPPLRSPIQLVEVVFPAGQRIAFDTSTQGVEQQVWMIEGTMEITAGDEGWQLAAGDCLAMRLDRPVSFQNTGARPARYLVVLATQTYPSNRGHQ